MLLMLLLLAQDPAPKPSAEEVAANRVVCKYEAKTGTRFKKRICHTRAQWDEIAQSAQRKGHEMIDRPTLPLTGPGPQ